MRTHWCRCCCNTATRTISCTSRATPLMYAWSAGWWSRASSVSVNSRWARSPWTKSVDYSWTNLFRRVARTPPKIYASNEDMIRCSSSPTKAIKGTTTHNWYHISNNPSNVSPTSVCTRTHSVTRRSWRNEMKKKKPNLMFFAYPSRRCSRAWSITCSLWRTTSTSRLSCSSWPWLVSWSVRSTPNWRAIVVNYSEEPL